MVVVSLFGTKAILPSVVNCSADRTSKNDSYDKQCPNLYLITDKPPSRYHAVIPYREGFTMRRRDILMSGYCSLATIVTSSCLFAPLPAIAEDNKLESQGDDDGGVVGALKSLLDPNETSKSGKTLPKAYLKSAKDVVKTLRESLKEDPKDMAKFRRTADSAKQSIRDYLSNWRGKTTVSSEKSYTLLEKAIRSLAGFYSKAGPSAPLPEEIKSEILKDLTKADEFL